MAGGARPGAGRPRGAINLLSAEARREAMATGLTPLQFMLGVMRDPEVVLERRLDAARAAAPFIHPRLQSVELSGPERGAIQMQTTGVIDAASMSQDERDALRKILQAAKARVQEQSHR